MQSFVHKADVHKLVDRLPDNATWDDLMHEIYVRMTLDRGLADSRSGRTTRVQEVRTKYGLMISEGTSHFLDIAKAKQAVREQIK